MAVSDAWAVHLFCKKQDADDFCKSKTEAIKVGRGIWKEYYQLLFRVIMWNNIWINV